MLLNWDGHSYQLFNWTAAADDVYAGEDQYRGQYFLPGQRIHADSDVYCNRDDRLYILTSVGRMRFWARGIRKYVMNVAQMIRYVISAYCFAGIAIHWTSMSPLTESGAATHAERSRALQYLLQLSFMFAFSYCAPKLFKIRKVQPQDCTFLYYNVPKILSPASPRPGRM